MLTFGSALFSGLNKSNTFEFTSFDFSLTLSSLIISIYCTHVHINTARAVVYSLRFLTAAFDFLSSSESQTLYTINPIEKNALSCLKNGIYGMDEGKIEIHETFMFSIFQTCILFG